MATLHVRSVPEHLYQRIQELAAQENVSVSAEVVRLLGSAVSERELRLRQEKVLADIRRRRFKLPPGAPSSLQLLREDRNR